MQSKTRFRLGLRLGLLAIVVLTLFPATFSPALAWTPTETNPVKYMQQVLHHFNLVTFQDYNSDQEIEGRSFIGRNLTGTAAQQFGIKLSTFLGGSVLAAEDTLVVMQNIVAGAELKVEVGSLYLGGQLNGRVINFQSGGGSVRANPAPTLATLQSKLQAASISLSTVSANNTVTLPSGGQSARLCLT